MLKLNFKEKPTRSTLIVGMAIILAIMGWRLSSSETLEEKTTNLALQKVTLLNALDLKSRTQTVQSVGQVEAAQEVDIRSQLSGEVKQIYVGIGDEVYEGFILAELERSNIQAQVAQSQAALERTKSLLILEETPPKQEEVDQSLASLDQAKASLKQAEAQLSQTLVGNETSLRNSEIALETAKKNLENTDETNNQLVDNAYESLRLTIGNNLAEANQALTEVGNIIGKSPGDITANEAYKNVLSLQNPQAKNDTREQFDQAFIDYSRLFDEYRAIGVSASTAEILAIESDLDSLLDLTFLMLKNTRIMLENTLVTADFVLADLNALKTIIDGQISSISTASTTQETRTQAVRNSELSLKSNDDSLQLAYEKAEQDLKNVKAQNEANLATAQANVTLQEAAVSRAESAHKLLLADPTTEEVASLKASIREAEAIYNANISQLNKTYIRAPISGKISKFPVKIGNLVNPGDLVTGVVNTNLLQVKTFINEEERKFITEGIEAIVTNSNPYKGIVSRISPSVDPQTQKIEVIITIMDEALELNSGEFIDVKIQALELEQETPLYFVPIRAVKKTADTAYVFTLNQNNEVQSIPVELGKVIGGNLEIVGGLTDSSTIIASAGGLEEGQVVEIKQ